MTGKRQNYLGWDETFMLMTHLIAQRSKDPNTQVGACIVNHRQVVVALGYNGFPRNCDDDALPWGRDGAPEETKYPYVVHAEANALTNANSAVRGCRMYCNLFPCNECAKLLIQHEIAEIIYEVDKYPEQQMYQISRRLLGMAGVQVRQFKPDYSLTIQPRS